MMIGIEEDKGRLLINANYTQKATNDTKIPSFDSFFDMILCKK